ncbi:unnamed protein product [Periconia digitata]|uniref:Uncharacterized protein n=1 Tax=Periconia digitata TaxID=1303443 RepID=A0A9W4U8M6_9PLEO|nr:unnamed protein product [Periconia digitata]
MIIVFTYLLLSRLRSAILHRLFRNIIVLQLRNLCLRATKDRTTKIIHLNGFYYDQSHAQRRDRTHRNKEQHVRQEPTRRHGRDAEERQVNPSMNSLPHLTHPPPTRTKTCIPLTTHTVLQAPLHKHTASGYCNPSTPIAALLTPSFLSFASSQSISLPASLKAGDRTCLSTRTWKSATDKLERGGDEGGVPRVKLEGTHVAALENVDLGVLKRWSAGADVDSGAEWGGDKKGGFARDSGEIGGKEPRA